MKARYRELEINLIDDRRVGERGLRKDIYEFVLFS